MDDLKTCSKCREGKPRGEFHRDASRRDGLDIKCRPCANAARAARHRADPSKKAASNAEWRNANRDREAARLRVKDAKRLARSNQRASRYARAFGYFEGRAGWTSALASSLRREGRVHEMTFKNPALEEYIAEFA